jgi:gliding motility-associated-like protein
MIKYLFLTLFGISISVVSTAQAPIIFNVEPLANYTKETVQITGTNFGTNASQIQVWFGAVKGTIKSISNANIEVEIPPQARHDNVFVVNTNTGLSAHAPLKSFSSFSGDTFDPTKMLSSFRATSSIEIFDLCVCDLDNDGKPDIAASKLTTSNDLLVLRNTSTVGNISFTQFDKNNLANLDVGITTQNIFCADLNGDGKPDLMASRSGGTRNSFVVLRNTTTTNLAFASAQTFLLDIGHRAAVIKVKDLNGDGKPEIIVSNVFNNVLYVYRNTSTLTAISFDATPIKVTVAGMSTTFGLEVQDLNNDGKPDIILTQQQSSNIFILRNESSGSNISFSAPQTVTLAGTLYDLVAADFNQDGKLDLVVTNVFQNKIHILYNQSASTAIEFAAPVEFTTGSQPWRLDVGDIDGDGDLDILVSTTNSQGISTYIHNGNFDAPTFTRQDITLDRTTQQVSITDMDGDGKPDVVYAGLIRATNTFSVDVLRNTHCYVPKIINDEAQAICPGQTIRLNAVPGIGASYEWKRGTTTVKTGADTFLDLTEPGTYTVIATSESGACVRTSAPVVISESTGTVPSNPVISSNSPACAGNNITLTAPTVANASYQWQGPNNFTSSAQNPVISNAAQINAGNYSLVIDVGGCKSNQVSTTVEVIDFPNLSISSSAGATICSGSNTTLSVSNLNLVSYQWFRNGTALSGQTNATLTANTAGDYTVRLTRESCETTTAAFTLNILSAPVASFTAGAAACTGQQITFTNTSTVDANATVVYNWNFGSGATSTERNPTHTFTAGGTVNVTLSVTYTGVSGCSSSANTNINVTQAVVPQIQASVNESCEGDEVVLSVSGNFNTITWSNAQTGSSITVSSPGTYAVNTTDQNNCTSSAEIVIAEKAVPVISVTASKTQITRGEEVQLTASGADTYVWTPEEGLSATDIANPIAKPIVTTVYTVTGTLTAACSASAEISIEVSGDPVVTINARKVFSPNNDGIDDLWLIEGAENYPDCVLSIFDGRGMRVYEAKGYNNDWNAEFNGRPLPQGTYFYVFACPDGARKTGSVLVIR